MSRLQIAPLADAVPYSTPRDIITTVEDWAVGCIMLVPILGLFYPPEAYFFIHSYAVDAAAYETSYPLTTLISRLVYVVIFLLVLRHWRDYLSELRYAKWILALFTFYIASTLWSEEPATTLKQSLHYFEYTLVAAHLLWRYDEEKLINFLMRLLAIMTVMNFLVILLFPGKAYNLDLTEYQSAWRGATANKNMLGMISALAIIISAYAMLRGRQGRYFSAAMLAGNCVLLLMSQSVTSLVGLIICCVIGGTFLFGRSSTGKLALGVGAAIAGTLLLAALMSSEHATDLLGRSATLTGRTSIWHAVVPMVLKRPLLGYGIGFWAFATRDKANIWAQIGWVAPHAHNDYLDLALQIGLFGTALAVWNNFRAILQALKLVAWQNDHAMVFLLILIFFLFRGFTETVSTFPFTELMMVIVLCQMRLGKSYAAAKIHHDDVAMRR